MERGETVKEAKMEAIRRGVVTTRLVLKEAAVLIIKERTVIAREITSPMRKAVERRQRLTILV